MSRLCREIATTISRSDQLRGADADGRHPAHRRGQPEDRLPIEACVFIGSSPIRQYAEEWESITSCVSPGRGAVRGRRGSPVMYVTEDTIRSHPEHLQVLLTRGDRRRGQARLPLRHRGRCGARGGDESGHAGSKLLSELGRRASASTGTVIGSRARLWPTPWRPSRRAQPGSTARRWASANAWATRRWSSSWSTLKLLGMRDDDLTRLAEYVETAPRPPGCRFRSTRRSSGRDAFRTATGVHAAAVIKAQRKGCAGWPTGLLGCPGGLDRPAAGDRDRADVGSVQCQLLSPIPRHSR